MTKQPIGKSALSTGTRPANEKGWRWFLGGGVVAVRVVALYAIFWSSGIGEAQRAYTLAPESVLPSDIRQAPEALREAYRFAIANREILRYIPCYCGCGVEGHTSNASCYLKDFSTPGNLVFDRMSLN